MNKFEPVTVRERLDPMPALLGTSVPRIDGMERVTGRSQYAGDWHLPGMIYGKVLMSTTPHADVLRIDVEEAQGTPGVEAILTCKDTQVKWAAGERSLRERYVLAQRIRFLGDVIAAVAARTREIAEEALSKIRVEYQELPAVFDPVAAMDPQAPKIWPEGNVAERLRYKRGDLVKGFESADFIFEDSYVTNRHHTSPLEPGVSLAWWLGDRLTVVAATQGITRCRAQLASDLGIPLNKVRVIAQYKGGGFGNKNNNMNYDLIASMLAKRAGKPVMVEYSRKEEFIGVHGRWGSVQNYKSGVKRDGTITALSLKALCDIGAYTRHSTPFEYVLGAREFYNCQNVETEVTPIYTNTPSTGNMRFPAGVPGCFAIESFFDQVANNISLNPLDFRLRNITVLADCERSYTSCGLKECIVTGSEIVGWKSKWHQPGQGRKSGSGKKHGIGMAICAKAAIPGKGAALVKINSDGSAEVAVGVTDVGTGAKTAMAIIAAQELGVPVRQVRIVWGDTDSCPFSIGESGSRTTSLTGAAVKAAAQDAKNQLLQKASKRLGIPIDRLEIRGGFIIDANDITKTVPLSEVTSDPDGFSVVGQATTDIHIPSSLSRMSFAAHFAEVEVDTETGMVDVTRYVAVHDSGQVVNKLTAESQVQGGVAMGLSLAFSEELLIDRELGTVTNPSLLTYHILPHQSMPTVEVVFVETADPYGPKPLGEIPVGPVAPCVADAIFNATGTRLKEIPMTPERVLRAIGKI